MPYIQMVYTYTISALFVIVSLRFYNPQLHTATHRHRFTQPFPKPTTTTKITPTLLVADSIQFSLYFSALFLSFPLRLPFGACRVTSLTPPHIVRRSKTMNSPQKRRASSFYILYGSHCLEPGMNGIERRQNKKSLWLCCLFTNDSINN